MRMQSNLEKVFLSNLLRRSVCVGAATRKKLYQSCFLYTKHCKSESPECLDIKSPKGRNPLGLDQTYHIPINWNIMTNTTFLSLIAYH